MSDDNNVYGGHSLSEVLSTPSLSQEFGFLRTSSDEMTSIDDSPSSLTVTGAEFGSVLSWLIVPVIAVLIVREFTLYLSAL